MPRRDLQTRLAYRTQSASYARVELASDHAIHQPLGQTKDFADHRFLHSFVRHRADGQDFIRSDVLIRLSVLSIHILVGIKLRRRLLEEKLQRILKPRFCHRDRIAGSSQLLLREFGQLSCDHVRPGLVGDELVLRLQDHREIHRCSEPAIKTIGLSFAGG